MEKQDFFAILAVIYYKAALRVMVHIGSDAPVAAETPAAAGSRPSLFSGTRLENGPTSAEGSDVCILCGSDPLVCCS